MKYEVNLGSLESAVKVGVLIYRWVSTKNRAIMFTCDAPAKVTSATLKFTAQNCVS